MTFIHLWLLMIFRPRRAFDLLQEKPAPRWGLYAILVRFVLTSVTSILALQLLNRRPFVSSYLTFLDEAIYYKAEFFFLPLFGVAAWLLSSALLHLILRLAHIASEIDWLMNVIGFSLLAVMPLVWVVDWSTIAMGLYGAGFTIPVHAAVSLWEVALMGIGFRQVDGVSWGAAVLLGLLVKAGVYIPLAAIFVR